MSEQSRYKALLQDIAQHLDYNNFDKFKRKARELVYDYDSMNGEEWADLINRYRDYDYILAEFFNNDVKKLNIAVKKIMTETVYPLSMIDTFYLKNKRSIKWFNDASKITLVKRIPIDKMNVELFKLWLDENIDESITFMKLDIVDAIFRLDDDIIVEIIKHKDFSKITYKTFLLQLFELNNLTSTLFDKLFDNVYFDIYQNDDINALISHKHFKYKHIIQFDKGVLKIIADVIVAENLNVDDDIIEYLLIQTQNTKLMTSDAKAIFLV